MKPKISLILPTYNENKNIEEIIPQIHSILKDNYEVVVVDDNSPDGTAETAKKLSPKYPVKVIVRKQDPGLSQSVLTGIKYCSSDKIGVMDSDFQHPPQKIPNLLSAINEGHDLVVGSRYIKGGSIENWSKSRYLISKISTLLVKPLVNIKDPMSGFFIFRKDIIKNKQIKSKGFKILLEIAVKSKTKNYKEVPINFDVRKHGKSKLDGKVAINFLLQLIDLYLFKFNRFIKFCLIGASGVIVNMFFLWFFSGLLNMFYLYASIIAIELSIISNFILNNSWTFFDRKNNVSKSFLKFNVSCLLGMAINISLLYFFTSIVGWHYLLSNFIGILAGTIFNFLLSDKWCFV